MKKNYRLIHNAGILSSNRGTILVGLVVLIVISAIAFSTAMYVMGDAIRRKREAATWQRLRAVQAAAVGHEHAFINDASADCGYFSRASGFTTAIGNLTDLQSPLTGLPATEDAFGQNITLAEAGGTYTIHSDGNNGVDNGGGGDDLEIEFSSTNRSAVDIRVQIVDATVSGASAFDAGKSYIVDVDGDGSYDAGDPYEGHVRFGPTWNNNLAQSDIDVTLHSAPNFETGGGTAPNRFSNGMFEWDNVPMGVHLLRIRADTANPNPDNECHDPRWEDAGGSQNTNLIHTPLIIMPVNTGVRRQFNVVYPVIANVRSLQETGAGEVYDETVTNYSNYVWDAMNDPDVDNAAPWEQAQEYQCVGSGCPDYDGYDGLIGAASCIYRTMRALVLFDLSQLPGMNGQSKISYARLKLNTHFAPNGPLGWSSNPRGNGTVQVYRFRHSWTEHHPPVTGTPYTRSTDNSGSGIAWNDVASSGSDYSDLQDSWAYNTTDEEHFFDVTEAVQQWTDNLDGGGWARQGFLIRNSNEASGNWWSFKSCETDDAATRPKLIVAYYR